MAIKFYIAKEYEPSAGRPFDPGFSMRDGRLDYGYYTDCRQFRTVVADAHFSVLAVGYDEDHDDFCTVLEIERPNGAAEEYFWWWEQGAGVEVGCADYGCARISEVDYLAVHYGMRLLAGHEYFSQCMASYRRDENAGMGFDTLDELRAFVSAGGDARDAKDIAVQDKQELPAADHDDFLDSVDPALLKQGTLRINACGREGI